MDMLELGTWTMTELEEQTHMSFWAALKSPLITGADLNNISDTSLAIYKNEDIIALNQDKGGKAAVYLEHMSEEGSYQVWAGLLASGKRKHVIIVQNYDSKDLDVRISLSDIPGLEMKRSMEIMEIWSKENVRHFKGEIVLRGIKPTQTKVLVIAQ